MNFKDQRDEIGRYVLGLWLLRKRINLKKDRGYGHLNPKPLQFPGSGGGVYLENVGSPCSN